MLLERKAKAERPFTGAGVVGVGERQEGGQTQKNLQEDLLSGWVLFCEGWGAVRSPAPGMCGFPWLPQDR